MNTENGTPAKPITRASIGIRIVADVPNYTRAGRMMDEVYGVLKAALSEYGAHFDFTSFETRPCKAMQMEHAMHGDVTDQYLPDDPITADSF